MSYAGFIQLVFIGIEHLGPGMPVDCFSHPQQRLFAEHVILVEKGDELTAGDGERGVGACGDPAVIGTQYKLHAGVASGMVAQEAAHRGITRSIVCDA